MAELNSHTVSREVLARLREAFGGSETLWTDLDQRVTPGHSPQTLRITENDLIELAEELELDPTELARGRIDYRALAAHQAGNVTQLPFRFERGESRIRTSAHVLDFAEERFGWRARARILRRTQVTESVLADPDLKVNVRFITEVCDELAHLGLSDDEFLHMGHRSLIRNYHSPVGIRFRRTRSSRDLLELCFTEIIQQHYDRNSQYAIRYLDDELAIIDVRPSPEVCDDLKSARVGSRLTCLNRLGGFSSLMGYRKLPFAAVHESRCIHRGDSTCRVEIDFTHATQVEKRMSQNPA